MSSFRKPRKTVHSDNRCTYQTIHDRILARLDANAASEYLDALLPLLSDIDTLSNTDARVQFASLASRWMTPSEIETFKDVPAHVATCEDARWCRVCQANRFMLLDERQATHICSECGACKSYIGASSERYLPHDHEPPVPSCPYRRSNHFQEWINAFMARQSSSVSDDVFNRIRAELRKNRVTDYSGLTQTRLRTIMKSLKLSKLYDAAPFILCKLKGDRPPHLAPSVEQELRDMFDVIQKPFDAAIADVCPERKNFLSYSYCLRQMLKLLGMDELAGLFSLLKSRDKLAVQDKIWKHICGQMGWRYMSCT